MYILYAFLSCRTLALRQAIHVPLDPNAIAQGIYAPVEPVTEREVQARQEAAAAEVATIAAEARLKDLWARAHAGAMADANYWSSAG